MSDINSKLAELDKNIAAEKEKLSRSVKLTILIYGLLLVFVVGYTLVAAQKIEELATPRVVAVGMADHIEKQLPLFRENMNTQVRTHAPVIAAELAAFLHSFIPNAETFATQQLDILADDLILATRDTFVPELSQYCIQTLDTASKNSEILKDKNIAKALAEMLAEDLDKEMDKIINNKFFSAVQGLRGDIDKLGSMPSANMNKLQASEKRVLMYWLFLMKHAEVGDSKVASIVRFLSFSLEFMGNTTKKPLTESNDESPAGDYVPVNFQF